jgi:peptidoglycan-N-acetylglucosamine deacetylase
MTALRSPLPLLAGALGATVTAYSLPALAGVSHSLRSPLGIHDRIPEPGRVALSFDDGPHPEGTPRVLSILATAGVQATFFPVGEQIERHRYLAAAVHEAGHELGVHDYRHLMHLRLTPRQTRAELDRAAETLGNVTGSAPRLYRPPNGVFTLASLALVRRRGWLPLLWRVDGRDWRATVDAQAIAARILGRVKEGDVILLHDSDRYGSPGSWRRTADALELLLRGLCARGLAAGPVTLY